MAGWMDSKSLEMFSGEITDRQAQSGRKEKEIV